MPLFFYIYKDNDDEGREKVMWSGPGPRTSPTLKHFLKIFAFLSKSLYPLSLSTHVGPSFQGPRSRFFYQYYTPFPSKK